VRTDHRVEALSGERGAEQIICGFDLGFDRRLPGAGDFADAGQSRPFMMRLKPVNIACEGGQGNRVNEYVTNR
jgi:hypothetical protein